MTNKEQREEINLSNSYASFGCLYFCDPGTKTVTPLGMNELEALDELMIGEIMTKVAKDGSKIQGNFVEHSRLKCFRSYSPYSIGGQYSTAITQVLMPAGLVKLITVGDYDDICVIAEEKLKAGKFVKEKPSDRFF